VTTEQLNVKNKSIMQAKVKMELIKIFDKIHSELMDYNVVGEKAPSGLIIMTTELILSNVLKIHNYLFLESVLVDHSIQLHEINNNREIDTELYLKSRRRKMPKLWDSLRDENSNELIEAIYGPIIEHDEVIKFNKFINKLHIKAQKMVAEKLKF